jgi:hypothetical protein
MLAGVRICDNINRENTQNRVHTNLLLYSRAAISELELG